MECNVSCIYMSETKTAPTLRELPKSQPLTAEERAALRARFPNRHDGRKVVVLAVATDDYGVEKIFPLSVGDVFPSVSDAARFIGLGSSVPLHLVLKNAKGAPARVRGVTFQYLPDFQKGKLNEPTI